VGLKTKERYPASIPAWTLYYREPCILHVTSERARVIYSVCTGFEQLVA
jgi:hypothetical protein